MARDLEPLLTQVNAGLRSFRMLILRNLAAYALIATLFALHAATWSRVVAVTVLLVFGVFYLLVPWVRAGFVGAGTLRALLREAPERAVWFAVHQVPNSQAHLQIHDEDRHSWRLRLPPEEVAALIASWRPLAPGAHVSMASTQREIEWFQDPTAPRRWPPAPPLELSVSGFLSPPS